MLKFPKKCPKCSVLDFDSDGKEEERIEDQIYECSECHTLFRARWKLVSFVQLEEKKEEG